MFKYIETRDAGAAVGQGGNKRVECSGNLKKCQLFLFLFSNNVDLKNNNRNYRKPFRIFWLGA